MHKEELQQEPELKTYMQGNVMLFQSTAAIYVTTCNYFRMLTSFLHRISKAAGNYQN
jgi:hypothetical protein